MTLADQVLAELQYADSPAFLRPGRGNAYAEAGDYGHIFRRASEHCRLRGVYSLRQNDGTGRDSIVPVVYFCEAESEQDADRVHRLVWNQNVAPFLILVSPSNIRLYSGFRYARPQPGVSPEQCGILRTARDMRTALEFLDDFRAERIDDGTVWQPWGEQVTPETRVDWKLLSSLNDLDQWLRRNGMDDPQVSHALIGKYVYLHYLRSREILSDRKLEKWGLRKEQIFGRTAQVSAFWTLIEQLEQWLNGGVFPLPSSGPSRPRQEHIRKVAGTFAGDDPANGQLALDFDIYDFSFIPISSLSYRPDSSEYPVANRRRTC